MTGRIVPGRALLAGLWAAVGFLTVLPVPERWAERGRTSATAFFPFMGVVLGLAVGGITRMPLDPLVASMLAVAFLAVVTGGLHWDGWADVVDATLTPAVNRERRVQILADAPVGAHAALGVALLALASVSALARAPFWAIVLGATLGRWVMVATLRWAPSLRAAGAGARMRGDARPFGAALGLVLLIAILFTGGVKASSVLVASTFGVVIALLFTTFLVRRLGGVNGDCHGAVGLLTEVVVWLTAAELHGVGS